jgi:hypothetical protein
MACIFHEEDFLLNVLIGCLESDVKYIGARPDQYDDNNRVIITEDKSSGVYCKFVRDVRSEKAEKLDKESLYMYRFAGIVKSEDLKYEITYPAGSITYKRGQLPNGYKPPIDIEELKKKSGNK